MAGALSDYLENKLLDHSLGTAAYTMPSTVYVALFTADPTDANAGTEVSGGGYERQAVTFNAASGGSTSNSADVIFPVATASWGTIGWEGIYDAATGDNLLWHGAPNTAKSITTDDQYKIAAGNLTPGLD